MAEDDNEAVDSKQSPTCTCKRSKIPVKSDSKTDTNKSNDRYLVVNADPTTKIVSKIPVPLTNSSSNYKLKIKVINNARSGINLDCKCHPANDESEEDENAPPKICIVCDCDSGICSPECLQAKKERIQKFMSQAVQRKIPNLDNTDKAIATEKNEQKAKENKVCEICKCTKPCNKACEAKKKQIEERKRSKNKICEICKCKKPCNNDCEANKKKIEEVKSVQMRVCEICKCKKTCNRDCEANKQKLREVQDLKNKICEICQCTKPCNPDCEDKKKQIEEAKNVAGKVCQICKCKKPCNRDCEANKIKMEEMKPPDYKICEICQCTKPCNPDCEDKKKQIEEAKNVAGKVCQICKCKKPCNRDCEANKIKMEEVKPPEYKICEICKCTKPCNPDCEEKQKALEANKVCEVCKCTKICNSDCEAKKKQIGEAKHKKICEICECTDDCNKECEELKKKKGENKICDVCKCPQPCNNDCEANKEKIGEVKENKACEVCHCVLPCNNDCEANKKKTEVTKSAANEEEQKSNEGENKKTDPVCEICKCSSPCNKDCEAKKRQKEQIDEICKCLRECMDQVESKRDAIVEIPTSIVSKNVVCEDCKCPQPCNIDCDQKKKLDAENKRTLYSEVQKDMEGKVCEICVCTDVCNEECLEKNAKEKMEKADSRISKLEAIVEENTEIDECCESVKSKISTECIETEKIKISAASEAETSKETSVKNFTAPGYAGEELTDTDKPKACEVCKCAIGACHAICEELKKLREDINKPQELVECKDCQCPPNPCNEVCLMTMSKTIETNFSVKTSTPTSHFTDYGCGTDDQQSKHSRKSGDKKSASEITSLISELGSVMSDIKSSCKKAESISKKSKRCRQTESEMRLVIEHLQQKCKMKDIFIDAMISDLSERKTSRVFDNLLCKIATNTKSVCDFDRTAIANALPRPTNRSLKTKHTGDCLCDNADVQTGFQIIVVKRVGPSLLIRWTASQDLCVIGYNVYVDGKVRGKVFNRLRTSVLLDCLDLRNDMRIEIYAMTKDGRNEPPAVSVYSACPS